MSTENELNKSLSEIYTNLESLQNAREQVEIVTKSSEGLTKSTSMLLQQLREFSNQFGKENTNTFSQLTQSLDSFEYKINNISEKGNESISEYIEIFKSQIVTVIDQFSEQIAENEKNLLAINNLNNEKIREKIEQFEKTTTDLKLSAETGINDVKNIALNEISKTIQHIIETNSKADKLIGVITNYDIPNSLEILNQKIDVQAKENKLMKILLFLIIGLLGIGITSFMVKSI
jgi:t-SNARE complex subunit (syntaxin)